jgi:very-short-patch-repair endonuclease
MPSTSSRSNYARCLRKNITDAERKLWYRIKKKQLGVKFRRQQPIGRYIVDFVCFERKMIVEVDGGQHDQCYLDTKRDEWFRKQGYRVLRFWNNDVLQNIEGVVEALRQEISPSPSSPPLKGGV